MPFYEFFCPDNNKIYTFFARSREQAEKTPTCPDDATFRMVKVLSKFAIGKGGTTPASEDGGGAPGDMSGGPEIDERAMMSVMGEMEQAMAGMDENNPDPKLLGRMMRRMAEVSGENLNGEMEEVVRKLEEGADPEALEAQFGDLMGGEGEGEGGMGGMGGGYGGGFGGKSPTRDPNIYDY